MVMDVSPNKDKIMLKRIDSVKRAELYVELRKQLDTPQNHALLDHLNAIAALETDLPGWRRIPLGLELPQQDGKQPSFTLAEDESGLFLAKPPVDVKITHLIVSEETAQHFDMQDFKIGKDSQLLTAESVPLDFFSVAHNQKALAKVSALRGTTCSAEQTVAVFARRRVDGLGPKTFQGLLWTEISR